MPTISTLLPAGTVEFYINNSLEVTELHHAYSHQSEKRGNEEGKGKAIPKFLHKVKRSIYTLPNA